MLASRPRFISTTLTAAALAFLPACGSDSPTGDTGDALTMIEAQELVTAFFDLLELIDIPPLETGPAAVPAAVPYGDLYDDVISGQMECDGSGFASLQGLITGDVDDPAGTADITATATATFVDCVHIGETSTLTIQGNPNIGIMADIVITEATIDITIEIDGGLSYTATDGRTGTCAMDLTVTASASSAGVVEGLTGSACGINGSSIDVSLFS